MAMWLEIEKLQQDVDKYNDDKIEEGNVIHILLDLCSKG